MFNATMSPKVLNVEKLEKKFASLTKSRESIQGLSMWIIRHKEFYRDIVNQWLDALTRDLNALTMFYVANDVIQNCGRKRAPEFRDAFATVLEKAMSLEKVKEIKNEVTRMITLWNERAIYDDIFFRKLQDRLNSVNEPELGTEESELSDADVIENFKLENLISSLRKLKTLEDELLEKESFLEDIEEPGMSNIDNLIVKMESQKELQKFDKFQNLVEDYISLSQKVIRAKKVAMLNLKYSSIFYSAQLEDAKKVAHAYRIYGKKVKMLEKSLAEKLSAFPQQSPVMLEKSLAEKLSAFPQQSPVMLEQSLAEKLSAFPQLSPVMSEKSLNVELDSSQDLKSLSIDPKTTEDELKADTADKKCKSPSTVTQSLPVTVVNTEKSATEKIPKNSSFLDTANNVCNEKMSKNATVIDISKSPNDEKLLKSPLVMDATKSTGSEKNIIKTSAVDKTPKTVLDGDKNLKTPKSSEHLVKDSVSLEEIVDLSNVKVKKPDSKESSNVGLPALADVESIDFLLEKAYDDHQVKSKLSFKRKIDNLLKSKQPKACKLSNDDNGGNSIVNKSQDNVTSDPDLPENLLQNASFLVKIETDTENSIKCESSVNRDESNNNSGCTVDAGINKAANLEQTEISKPDKHIEMEKTAEISDLANSTSLLSSASFAMSSLPDIPTELLKNILDKNRKNMNTSFSEDPCTSSDGTNYIVDNKDQSEVSHANLNDSSMENSNQDSSIKTLDPDSKKFNNRDIKNVCDEMLIKDAKDGCEVLKKSLSSADLLSSVGGAQKKSVVKSTNFLENLQNVLECLTNKETNINKLKCSETLNNLPSVPLKNTLNVYSCIMQCCGSGSLNSNLNGNVNSNVPAKDCLNDKKPCSFGAETVLNFQETLSVNKDLSPIHENKTGFTEFTSKDDNLEIMDMEVDSDDENSK